MEDLQKIVVFVTQTNWVLVLATSIVSMMISPPQVSLGVLLGGLIVAINFHLLKKTIIHNFRPQVVKEKGGSLLGNLLVKYYIRFMISAGVIFWLISNHIVHPLGLLAGLSVVVASIFLATIRELTRLFFKEAV